MGESEKGWPRSKSGIKGVSIPICGWTRDTQDVIHFTLKITQFTPIQLLDCDKRIIKGICIVEATTKGDARTLISRRPDCVDNFVAQRKTVFEIVGFFLPRDCRGALVVFDCAFGN